MKSGRLFSGTICFLLIVLLSASVVMAAEKRYQRTVENYQPPAVVLINQDREKINFKEWVENSDRPVMVDFVYGTCTTICPVLSAGYSSLQRKLAPDSEQVRLVSVTIDPEYDTPEVMSDYLKRYKARAGWDFFTGSREDINRVMHAFDAYVPDKMSHYPLTLLRDPKSGEWIRIYGLIGTRDLMTEYRKLVAQ